MLKETLSQILKDKTPRVFGAVLRPYPELKQKIQDATQFLPSNVTLAQRLFHILNDIDSVPLCKNCGETAAKFNSFIVGYMPYCGSKCANSCPDKKETTQKSWIEKYGSKKARADHIREVHKATMLEKTGFESKFHDPEFQKTHNGGLFAWTPEIRNKRTLTCNTKYGVDHVVQSDEFKKKTAETFASSYENGHPMRDPLVLAKREEFFFEKYGVVNPRMHPDVCEKAIQTCITKYGVPNPAQKHIQHIDLWHDNDFIKKTFLNPDGTIRYREMMGFFGCNHDSGIRQRLNTLGVEYKPYTGYSIFETEIEEFLLKLCPTIIIEKRNRTIIKPYEIDLYLPEYKVGIEFHGLTWHSFGAQPNNAYLESKNKNTHKNKADNADAAGIQLLQIFENEWVIPMYRDIWESMIAVKLGFSQKIHGRKCKVVDVEYNKATEFLRNNHMQGGIVGATACIGLVYSDTLVALMSFGKTRFRTSEQWELLRFCTLKNKTVLGGFSKLLKYFVKTHSPKSIISYANRRWSKGDVYDKNKLTWSTKVDPGYYYYHQSSTSKLYHRIGFQKHKLKDKLEFFDPDLTETENMYINGYRKIYDAGQLKYTITY